MSNLCCRCKTNPRDDRTYCGPCRRRYTREHRYRTVYGITIERYESILEEQGGVCAICLLPPDDETFLSVDHDHETGEVRGLLHTACNLVLGNANDDPARLVAAAAYLLSREGSRVRSF